MRVTYLISSIIVLLSILTNTSCGTNEENYKNAYEKAKEHKTDTIGSTIYTRVREMSREENVMLGDELVKVTVEYVSAAKDAGFTNAQLKKYNVVVGQFKQIFHAKSMRNRMAAGGYEESIIVATSEPLYYVIALSSQSLSEVKNIADSIGLKSPVKLKDDFPWILRASNR